ncbi:MAG: hypothetical protein JW910_01120, partial [Anaerolineae bacterium]|nr:hypothetical protein [Anaerolineae bacterium]
GVPTTYVNGEQIVGAQSVDVFADAISAALAAAPTPQPQYVQDGLMPQLELLYDGRSGTGSGALHLENVLDFDAVAVLAGPDGTPLLAAQVPAGASLSLPGIPTGTYTLYVAVGEQWDAGTGRYTRTAGYWQMQPPLVFVAGGAGTVYTLALYPVPGQLAQFMAILPAQFPVIPQ